MDDFLELLRNNRRPFTGAGAGLLLLFLAITSTYKVDVDEEAVVLRFGRYDRTTQPGLRFKVPFGVERIDRVKTRRHLRKEFGFRTKPHGQIRVDEEALMLTGDLNVADVQWIVQYRVQSPKDYLFNVRDTDKTLSDVAEASMRLVVGDRSVDDVLTRERAQIGDVVRTDMQGRIDAYNLGVKILTVKLQNVNPPDAVRPSFNEVNAARQEKETLINEAKKRYNTEVPVSKGEAKKIIAAAEAYAIVRMNDASGGAERFVMLARKYREWPNETMDRMYFEKMAEILPRIGRVIIVDPKVQSVVPFLRLGEHSPAPLPNER